jgi:hypothetical protein
MYNYLRVDGLSTADSEREEREREKSLSCRPAAGTCIDPAAPSTDFGLYGDETCKEKERERHGQGIAPPPTFRW